MNREEQIKELAGDIYSMIRSDTMSRALASLLCDKGWKKQSPKNTANATPRAEVGEVFVSRDFVKRRPHIHYLMMQDTPNSAHVIATFNSKNNTITLKAEAFALCSVAPDFIRLSLADEEV
jgi:hypothetical protein